jgi:hypothetical protein
MQIFDIDFISFHFPIPSNQALGIFFHGSHASLTSDRNSHDFQSVLLFLLVFDMDFHENFCESMTNQAMGILIDRTQFASFSSVTSMDL